ncbi:MAG: rhomboid family intramembrane serine protease [Gemmatimonadota bacterium]|nr:rhomboid family intramembrane serine protease [Gemmatimonadota bacterium]
MMMTPWVTRLLFANAAVFLLQMTMTGLENQFALVPALGLVRPWTFVTYMFLHGGLGHIFFNMLSLFFFGPRLEERLGSRSFLWLYFVSGITGGLLSLFFTPNVPIIGASGAVFGVMLGYATFWPRHQILIWGIIPVEARWMVVALTAISLWSGLGGGGGGIAHFAHLGGFLGAWITLRVLEARSPTKQWQKKAAVKSRVVEGASSAVERFRRIPRDNLHPVNRDELDRVLDKIGATGMSSLTPSERDFLERFSARS